MGKNNGEKEKFFEKMNRVQKENKEEQKRIIEKIKEDKALYDHVINLHSMRVIWLLYTIISCISLISLDERVERLEIGILFIVVSVAITIVEYVNYIRPLKK